LRELLGIAAWHMPGPADRTTAELGATSASVSKRRVGRRVTCRVDRPTAWSSCPSTVAWPRGRFNLDRTRGGMAGIAGWTDRRCDVAQVQARPWQATIQARLTRGVGIDQIEEIDTNAEGAFTRRLRIVNGPGPGVIVVLNDAQLRELLGELRAEMQAPT